MWRFDGNACNILPIDRNSAFMYGARWNIVSSFSVTAMSFEWTIDDYCLSNRRLCAMSSHCLTFAYHQFIHSSYHFNRSSGFQSCLLARRRTRTVSWWMNTKASRDWRHDHQSQHRRCWDMKCDWSRRRDFNRRTTTTVWRNVLHFLARDVRARNPHVGALSRVQKSRRSINEHHRRRQRRNV